MHTFGFIGTGNMGSALARAAAKALNKEEILLSDSYAPVAEKLAQELGCEAVSVDTVAAKAKFVWLGVKPQVMAAMLSGIAPTLAARTDDFVLVSMAAGVAMADIQKMAGGSYPVIRIMPNLPVSVSSGMILYDATDNVSQTDIDAFCENMRYSGRLDRLPEKLIDAGSALSGCGPAFASLFVEALADGAVACGLPRSQAVAYAAQTLAGTAKMILEKDMHPGQLKDAVCSPGGSTIAGVNVLEQGAFRAACMEAVIAAYQRTLELGK